MNGAPPAPFCLVSACLCGVSCRYDGRAATMDELAQLYAGGLALVFCPEVAGGLPTPRPPCELVEGRALTRSGRDFSANLAAGAERALALVAAFDLRLAVLKENSPSCGLRAVYDGNFQGRLIPGRGITAALLAARGIKVISEREFAASMRESGFYCRTCR